MDGVKRKVVGVVGLVGIVSIILTGCRTKYVPVESVRTEYITKTQYDSIYIENTKHDSIYVERSGDTLFIDRFHTIYKDRWHYAVKKDTVIKTDSMQVPYPIEKELTKWERIKMQAGCVSLVFCLLLIIMCVFLFMLEKRIKRK